VCRSAEAQVGAVDDEGYILSSLFKNAELMHSVLRHDNIMQAV
jgi:hypothetical protein